MSYKALSLQEMMVHLLIMLVFIPCMQGKDWLFVIWTLFFLFWFFKAFIFEIIKP